MTVHHPTHWIAVAAALALGLLAFEVAGQTTTAAGNFQGRPALAGAQGGLGAQAGLPQGGIGLQGSDGAQITLRRPEPADITPRPLPACEGPTTSAAQNPACLAEVRDEGMERRLARLGLDDPQQRAGM